MHEFILMGSIPNVSLKGEERKGKKKNTYLSKNSFKKCFFECQGGNEAGSHGYFKD